MRWIKIAGKEYEVRYTFKSLYALEQAAGEAVGELVPKVNHFDMRATVLVIWAGLLAGKPDITQDEVFSLLEKEDRPILAIVKEFVEALTEDLLGKSNEEILRQAKERAENFPGIIKEGGSITGH